MKFIRLFLIAAVLSFFLSCSKDNNVSTTTDKIVGQWKVTGIQYKGTSTTNNEGIVTTASYTGKGTDMNLHLQFTKDPNTYHANGDYNISLATTVEIQGQTQTFNMDLPIQGFIGDGSWETDGKKLIITIQTGEKQVATIAELNDKSMKILWGGIKTVTQPGVPVPVDLSVKGTYTFVKE